MPSGPIQRYFKVLVGKFDIERKCHVFHGTSHPGPDLSYITDSLSFLSVPSGPIQRYFKVLVGKFDVERKCHVFPRRLYRWHLYNLLGFPWNVTP